MKNDSTYDQPPLFPLPDHYVRDSRSVRWSDEIAIKLGVDSHGGWPDRFGNAIHRWASAAISTPIRTLSLFSGGGGLDIAFHDAGFQILEMVEIDERFAATLKRNSGSGERLGQAKTICKDIREYTPEFKEVDFIIGGPPCQTFSSAGRRASGVAGTTDDRGMLFNEYVRLIRMLTPKAFCFENVYGILGARGGKDWAIIRRSFEEAGYRLFFRILDAADFGVPQHRERLIIVGLREGEFRFPRPTHGPDSLTDQEYYSARCAIEGVAVDAARKDLQVRGRFGHLLREIPPGLNYSFFTEEMGHPQPIFAWRSKFSDFLYKADPDQPVRTIKASGGQYTGPFHWENRRFTSAEFKRLQTFPDEYALAGPERIAIKQIGNSVPPQFGRIIALAILEQVFGASLPVQLQYLESNEELGFRKRKRELTDRYGSKAKQALVSYDAELAKIKATAPRSYYARVSDNFEWSEYDANPFSNGLKVTFLPSSHNWVIYVGRQDKIGADHRRLSIIIRPRVGITWNLGVEEVCLHASELEPEMFTALWKAFESELIRGNFKADLVQLNSYYQYQPKLAASVEFMTSTAVPPEWLVVQAVTAGKGVRETASSLKIALDWSVEPEQVLEYALFLRKLGFEVRNWNTNPQIPEGHFLIPYHFPTLTSLSVQLRKSLTNGA